MCHRLECVNLAHAFWDLMQRDTTKMCLAASLALSVMNSAKSCGVSDVLRAHGESIKPPHLSRKGLVWGPEPTTINGKFQRSARSA